MKVSREIEAKILAQAGLAPAPARREQPVETTAAVEQAYRRLALERHPDRGGSTEAMSELNGAFDEFKKGRGL